MKIKLNHSFFKIIFGIAILLLSHTASAQIASWNFEPFAGADTNPTPNIGAGTSAIVNNGGGAIGTPGVYQRTGMTGTGCGAQNGSALGAWAFEPFAPGSSNESNGAQFNVSTVGYQDINLTWDQRFSDTSANTVRLQYTTNGSTWVNFAMTASNTTICAGSINANGCYENNAGSVYRRIAVDFSAITAANNNANFAVRILASYYQSTTEFRQSAAPASVANPAGTWRFDNITFTGTPLTVPNPSVMSGTTSICPGSSANITVTITGGISPYTLVYTDGTSNFTVNNYASGTNIPVSPSSTKTYTIVSVTDSTSHTGTGNSGSAIITVNPLPTVSFIAQPGATACANSDVTYTTQAGKSNYVWTISGILNTDYSITSGGSTSSNTVTIKWLTTSGTKTVTVNYTDAGCTAASATTSTATTIYALPATPTFTAQPGANACNSNNIVYTTQTGRFNYAWTFSGTPGTDYTIISGGTTSSNTVTINWITGGSKTVTVNYSNQSAPNCGALVAASNTTNVNVAPVITVQNATAAQTTCIGTPFSALSVTATGTNLTYQWWVRSSAQGYITPSSGGSPILGATSSSFTPPSSASGTNYYYVAVSNTGCTGVKSNCTLAYTVNPISVGGSIGGSTTVCATSNSTVLTLTGQTGNVTKWQSSTVSDFSSSVTDIANTTNTLTATNLVTTTYYRAIVTSGVCAAATSGTATITVSAVSDGGIVAGTGTVCSSATSSTLTLSGQTGNVIKWQSSPVSNFSSSVTDIANNTTSLTVTNVTATTYYRAVVQNNPCSVAYSSVAQLTLKTTTWNGSAWSNGLPDSSTMAIFASLYNQPTDLQACSVQVLNGSIVTIPSGYTLTVQNDVTVVPNMLPTALIIADGANLIQVNNVINSSYIYYRRNSMPMKQYDYTYWSSPVANETLSAFSPDTLVYLWDTGIYNWSYVDSSVAMDVAKGYIIRAPDVAPFNTTTMNIFNGQFFGIPNNGTITAPIVVSGANDMNLIGNPYPSAIDADTFLTYNAPSNGGVLNGTIFYWTHNTPITDANVAYDYAYNDYASYNLTGGISTAAPSNSSIGCPTCNGNLPNGKIGAGQAFFIQGLGNGVATFTNAMRFGINTQFYKNNSNSVNAIQKNRLWLDIANENGLFKQTLIGYIDGATNGFDTSFDGLSVDVGNPIMMYTLLGDKKLAIQGRGLPFNETDVIEVGYKSLEAGNFEIKLSNFDGLFTNQDVYLEDTLLNAYVDLKNGNYSFTTEAGTFDNRFKLHFTASSLGTHEVTASSFVVYQNNGQIHINANQDIIKEVSVYDMQGRTIGTYKAISSSDFSFTPQVKNEVIILKITDSENVSFYKKIIN